MELEFKRDTAFRKQFFTPESFAHPAKMDAHLLLWIVEKYTKPGEVILDPMAGMGTTMLACTLGRNVVLVELEEKFCNMCKSNWEKVSAMPQLGYDMGQCNIIQGDARQLEGLVDKIVTSPPYAEAHDTKNLGVGDGDRADLRAYSWLKEDNPDNISNLPYGQIDKIVTSDKGQGESDMSIVYITFFEVDNPIALLMKTLVPSSILGSLSRRAMPEIAISLNDSGKGGQEEVNRISANGELTDKLNSLLVKVFGNRAFKTREPSFSITLKGAENTPIAVDAVGLDIEGILAESTLAFYASSARGTEALVGAELLNPSFVLVNPYPELLITHRASSPEASRLSSSPTSTGTVFASIIGEFARSLGKDIPAYLASFLNTNSPSHLLTPLSIIPQISSIITSPPYQRRTESHDESHEEGRHDGIRPPSPYQEKENIGRLEADTYLEAMLQVYQQCHKVLKPQGLMILVTKNFIRNKQIIRLDEDTIKLCQQAGFSFVERHYRKLLAQSFWRTIYHQKYPGVEKIKHEDVIIFRK